MSSKLITQLDLRPTAAHNRRANQHFTTTTLWPEDKIEYYSPMQCSIPRTCLLVSEDSGPGRERLW